MAMGRAAARTVGNLVYLLLTSNGKFTDGKALFHADHKNLIAKDMDMEGLNEARKLMRLQEDANGDSLNITPHLSWSPPRWSLPHIAPFCHRHHSFRLMAWALSIRTPASLTW